MDNSKNTESQNFDSSLQNNPFTNNLKIVVSKLEDKTTYQSTDGILLHKEYYFEREPYIKLYNNHIHRKLIANLSGNSIKLLFWLMYRIKRNQDYIKIDKTAYLKENNINSINTYKAAIKELQINLLICPAIIKDYYFINPCFFFAGNRIKYYPENVVIYAQKTIKYTKTPLFNILPKTTYYPFLPLFASFEKLKIFKYIFQLLYFI